MIWIEFAIDDAMNLLFLKTNSPLSPGGCVEPAMPRECPPLARIPPRNGAGPSSRPKVVAMLRSAKDLFGYAIRAVDGGFGRKVHVYLSREAIKNSPGFDRQTHEVVRH